MLVPRFTLRSGLFLLTAGALVAIVIREALREQPWAIGVSFALGAAVLSIAIQAACFGLSLLLSRDTPPGDRP